MPEIVFPLSSSPGLGHQESGGRLINAYTEKLSDQARARTVRRRVPGLTTKVTVATYTHTRGFMYSGSVLYTALDNRLVKLTGSLSSLSSADLGELSGSDHVTFAQNNAATPDKFVVTEQGVFTVTDSAAPASFVAPNLPQPINCFQIGGYVIFVVQAGQLWATGLNDDVIDALSFISVPSKRDTLLRGVAYRNQAFAFCEDATHVYTNEGTSPFPLAFHTTIPKGIRGKWAVAGHEDGAGGVLLWAADDHTVRKLDGYQAVRVSTHDVERDIASVVDGDTIEACVYSFAGHTIWSLSGPDWTWEYNLTTGLWHERQSYNESRWRASQTVNAFGAWLAGDRETGKIFQISETEHEEGGNPLIATVESSPASNFPGGVAIPRMDFDIEAGVGDVDGSDETETNPQAQISWSDDGGALFGSPILRSLGQAGQYRNQIRVNRTGTAGSKGRIVRVAISDPCRFSLYGGTFEAEGTA